ncbi:MAG: M15 family metallopeptidase [Lachnospiraceae bacterium]|nr:M15 family metallopeptidase [Lachnospiraceae bacterium]
MMKEQRNEERHSVKKYGRRRRKVRGRIFLLAFMILVGGVLAGCGLTARLFRGIGATGGSRVLAAESTASKEESSAEEETADAEQEELAAACRALYEEYEDLLVLVNKEHAMPEEYEVTLKMLNNGRVEVAEVLYDDLTTMLTEAAEEGGYTYYLMSGYRDAEYQQSLVDADVLSRMTLYGMTEEEALEETLRYVMPAGYSEHKTGLALDIVAAGNSALDESQASEPGILWLHENSWRYGFILRYPEDKEDITQIDYEPWHFRYVGREAAQFLYEQNLTLEELCELADVFDEND